MNQKIIKEKLSRQAVEVVKERVYVDSREEAPGGVQVQQGEQGGLWYESSEVEGEAEEDVDWVETGYGEVPDTDGPIPPDMRDEPIGSDSHPVLWKRPDGEEETEEYINEIQDTEWYGEGSEIFQKAFNGPENTENYHTDEDGNWDEERLEKHEEWSEELLNEDAAVDDDEEPIGMILLGPPGAGKGWWQEQVEEGEYGETGEFVEREFTAISSDRTKEPIPEYEETNASEVHDEASKMAKENLAPQAMEERHNVIVDKVATSPDSTLDMIDTMREQGYDVRANFVNVPTGKSIHNAVSRYFEEGRFTPLDFANGAVEQSRESFNTILDETEIPDEKVGRFDNDVEWGNAPEAEFVGEELLKEFLDVLQKYKRDPVEAENGGKDERKTRPGCDRSGDSGMDGGRLRSLPGGRNGGSRDGRVSKRKLVLAAESILEDSSEDFSDGWVVGKEWVNDPTEEAPNRWTNTETGEYRYQESKPSPGSGSSQNQESDEASRQEIDPDNYRTVALGEIDIEEGTLLDFGGEALEVETVVNDPSATFGPNAGYVQLSDGTYANLMGDKPGNGEMEDIPEDEIRAFTEADALVEEDPETTGTADVDDWSIDWGEVQYDNFGGERGDRDLIRLDEKQKRRFRNEWEDAAPETGVEAVSSTMKTIKGSTMNTDGQFYDKLVKQTFGVEGEPRSGDFEDADSPSEEAVEAMRMFAEASQKFAEETFGEEFEIHRGLGDHAKESVLEAAAEWYLGDADDTFEMRDNPASVWTTDDKMADSYSKNLKAHQRISSDEVMAMPEALLDFSATQGPDWNEGEVNVSGWDMKVTPDDFTVTSGHGDWDVTLRQAMEDPVELYYEHDAGGEALRNLSSVVANHGPPRLAYELHREITSHHGYDRDDEDMTRPVSRLEEARREVIQDDDGSQMIDVRGESEWLSEVAREFQEEDEKEKLADNFIENLLKGRVYVDDPAEVPEDVNVQEGEEGGTYYETNSTERGGQTERPRDSSTEVGGGQSSKEGVDFDVPVIDLSDGVETVSQQIEEHPAVKSSSTQEHDGEEYVDFIVHSTYGDEAHGDYIVEDYAGVFVERVGRVGGDPVYAFDPPDGVEFQDIAGGGNPFEQMVDKAIERIFSKDRVYVDSPEEAPGGVNVQEGEEGGTYYETGSSDEQDSDEIASGNEVTIENFGEEQDVTIVDPNLPGGILVEDEDGNQFSVGEREIVGRESDSQDMLDGIMDDFESVDEDEDDEDEVMSGEERRELFEDMMDNIPELPEEPDGDEAVQGVETDVSEFSGGDRVVSEEDIEAVSETLSDGSLLGLSMEMRDVENEEDYGPFEPSTGIGLYDGDNSKYAHTDIVMDTDDFSNLQAQIHEEYSDVDRVRHFGSAEAERVEEYAESMESGEKFPMPHIVMNDEGQVVNEQEGRHRALAALEAGVQELPVRVVVEPGRNTKTYKLKREVLHKIGWIPLASESPNPERERVDADWNEVEDEEELADKFVKRVLKKYRIYVDSPSDAPEGALCREGPSGAWFYYSNQTQSNSPTRVYISSPDDAPEECTVRGGPSGGYYYYSHEHPRGQV